MADTLVAELDALLAGVVAQAPRLQAADDAEQQLRGALEPVRELFLRVLSESGAQVASDAMRLRAQQHWSEAATKIQALVRGKYQRGQLQRQLSFHLQGTKVLKKYVLKRDRFPNCHVLDTPHGDSAPNFRRLDDTPLYGAAQPTLEGIKLILNRVAADGFSHVVWVNLREEAVIYVDGTPFTARRSAKLNENDLVPGITGHTVQVLESSMKKSLQEQLALSDGVLEYWNEPTWLENQLESTQVDPSDVQTLSEIYENEELLSTLDAGRIESLRYYRIPIERENAPEHGDVEKMMELIAAANAPANTAFVFNCQMGKRRTTTALVIGSLIWQRPKMHVEDPGLATPPPTPLKPQTTSRSDGNFAAICELTKRLPFGTRAKQWVDSTIDACAAICNIREVIHEYHELSVSEAKPAKRSYYLHHALSFLERYFYLIVFGAYMLALQQHQQSQQVQQRTLLSPRRTQSPRAGRAVNSFSKWLQHHPNLFRLLDDLGGVRYKSDKLLKSAVLKFDHFPGIARIPFVLTPNVPNFRQIANEPIFGTAQCLEDGIRDVALHAMELGFDRAIWINLREEAVVYVTGKPFVVRHKDKLMENVEYPGIEVDEIVEIEQQVKEEMQARVRRANGLFMYWHEPREFVSEEKIDHINPDVEIKTLHEVYAEVSQDTGFDMRYARIPVSDETAPEEKDLDDMVRLLVPVFMEELRVNSLSPTKKTSKKTAVVCNCQMGRGRTTTALVCAYMLRLVLEDVQRKENTAVDTVPTRLPPPVPVIVASEATPLPAAGIVAESVIAASLQTTTLDRILMRSDDTTPEELRRQSSRTMGEFVVIRKLCATLANGAQAKALVDYAVDKCEHLQNLRECIAQCRDLAMDRELSPSKHDYYMLRAVNYLERYFYLICFASYLLEERHHVFRRTLFVTWMNERYGSALYALLDNLCFEEEVGAEIHVSSMRWRWRRKRKLISRLE